MSPFSSFGVAKRLYVVSTLVAVALVGVTTFASLRLEHIAGSANAVETRRVPQLQRIAAIELDITRVSLQLRHALLGRTPEEQTAALDDIGVKRRQLDKTIAEYEQDLLTDDERQRFAKLKPLMAAFWVILSPDSKVSVSVLPLALLHAPATVILPPVSSVTFPTFNNALSALAVTSPALLAPMVSVPPQVR